MTPIIYYLGYLLLSQEYEVKRPELFTPEVAARVIVPSLVGYWCEQEFTPFTKNGKNDEISWVTYPEKDVKVWTKEMVQSMESFSAGQNKVVIGERTIVEEFCKHNKFSEQNLLFFLNIVQKKAYGRVISSVIDCSKCEEDIYVFNKEYLTGAQLQGTGLHRWSPSIMDTLNDCFFVQLSKIYYEKKRELTDRTWLKRVMEPAIRATYSKEFADVVINRLKLSSKVNDIIQTKSFDVEAWPISYRVSQEAVMWYIKDIADAYNTLILED